MASIPRICWGKKVKGEKRLICDEEVDDPRIIEKVDELINVFLDRVERHKAVLLSGSNTSFDEVINALDNWLSVIEERISESGDDENIKLRKTMNKVGGKLLELARQAREKWLRTYQGELMELLSRLRDDEATVIIRGEPFDENKSFAAYLYTDHLAINVRRVAKSGDITMNITLTGLDGVDVVTPKLFDDNVLRAMQYGWLLTDGSVDDEGYPRMVTNHLWQAIAWALTWPGESHVRINGLSINDGDVKVKWHLRATDHKGVIKSKAKVVKEVVDLSDDKFLTFLLSAVLGDGSIDAKEKRVWLTIGNSKYELWKGIVDRMRSLSFKERNRNHLKVIKTRPSRAVDLARKWLSNQLIKSLIEDLSLLPDADKLKNLITLAGMRVKPLGRLMIEIIDGIWMNVNVSGSGCVVLRVVRKNREDATAILEKLKNAGYDAELRTWNNGYCVYISYDKLMNYPERIKTALIKKVCEILRKMLDEALNEKNKKRTRAVTKAMANLRCQGTPNISA